MAVVPEWIEAHCIVPDGFRGGEPFRLYDWQLKYTANFYLVRGDAIWVPENPVLAPAFVHRRGMIVGPQKLGKDPLEAAHICVEAVGPALFGGWAGKDDGYACRDHGCRCGWEYAYDRGEPMGMLWASPYIQITAFSEDQTGNTYGALRPMIDNGPLHDLIPKTGEDFIRLPGMGDCRITTVTSNAPTRLGQRTTFCIQGEVGIWMARTGMIKVADTQYRNLAGTGGRASLSTNAWDPAERSVAQLQFESTAADVYRQFVRPPASLSFKNKAERRKIFRIVYEDSLRERGGHVDPDSIEAEAADLVLRDPAQAERFFGNRLVAGAGRAFDIEVWNGLRVKREKVVPKKALIVIGGDGSRLWDHFSLIATEVASGYQWPLGIWVPQGPGKEVPMDQVDLAMIAAHEDFDVWRSYLDPPYIESWIATWKGRWGDDRVIEWFTARPKAMAYALRSWAEAQRAGEVSHCAETHEFCTLFSTHVGNAVKRETGFRDDGGSLWTVEKDRPGSPNKIDSVPAGALSWEARNDAIAAGVLHMPIEASAYDGLTERQIIARMRV